MSKKQNLFEQPKPEPKQTVGVRVISNKENEPGRYEPNLYKFKPWDKDKPETVHTTIEMLECLTSKKHASKVSLDARVICVGKENAVRRKMEAKKFTEAFTSKAADKIKFKESSRRFKEDGFAQDGFPSATVGGPDYTPLLGGPFYKNLYYYQDYIRMHADAFFAYNNDPYAHACVDIFHDFVFGTGLEVQVDMTSPQANVAMAAWKAYCEVNEVEAMMSQFTLELSMYGETMLWKLPNNQTKITYRLGPTDTKPTGIIPRVRLIDPSNIVEIVTYPEDISRKLFYVWLTPTQYQIFSGGGSDAEDPQPSLKFIYRQIPAMEMLHYKVNCVSNEKRGRSDLFSIFNYLKRLRDSIDYSLIALQKVSAYSIDTSIDGDQSDIDAYVAAQKAIGTIPPAGSEFVHSTKVKRTYAGNDNATGSTSSAFDWALSSVAAGFGIPISYFGTHHSGGSNRASALVSTEPIAKKIEKRREVIKRAYRDLWNHCMQAAGITGVEPRMVFSEIITQDRSVKMKDIRFAEDARWIKPERAATLGAKELGGITDYNYPAEIADIKDQLPQIPQPLLDQGEVPDPTGQGGGASPLSAGGALPGKSAAAKPKSSGLSSDEKVGAKDDLSTL